MAFTLVAIERVQGADATVLLTHNEHVLTAQIPDFRREFLVVGTTFIAEIEWYDLHRWQIVTPFTPTLVGIWHDHEGIHLQGVIHQWIALEAPNVLADVYIGTGPEFFTVTTADLGMCPPSVGTGIHLIVAALRIYPVYT